MHTRISLIEISRTRTTTKKSLHQIGPDPKLPMLIEQQQNATMKTLAGSYGKVIITWNPSDEAPIFPAQEIQVQHPFMVNTTVSPETETQAGTFNQTLEH
jgi:hypothetical protein